MAINAEGGQEVFQAAIPRLEAEINVKKLAVTGMCFGIILVRQKISFFQLGS